MKTALVASACTVLLLFGAADVSAQLKAGAAVVDVTPEKFPVLVNGGMPSRSADKVKTPSTPGRSCWTTGEERLGIVVVDSCMMPRPLLDEAKALAAQRTKIRPDRMLISAIALAHGAVVHGLPGHGRRSELRAVSSRETRRSPRGRGGEPRTGPGGLGRRKRRRVHGAATLDSPARSNRRRSVRQPDRPGQHARRTQLGRRDRRIRPGRSRPVADFVSGARRTPDRRAGQLLHALLWRPAGSARITSDCSAKD